MHSLDPRIAAAFTRAEANRFPLAPALIGAVVMGSTAHNTKLADGEGVYRPDYDICGVLIPPPSYVLGMDSWRSGSNCWTWKGAFADAEFDVNLQSLQKFAYEILRGSQNLTEWLWARPEDTVASTPAWETLRAARGALVSKRLAKKLLGFADSHLRRLNQRGDAIYGGEQEYQDAIAELELMGFDPVALLESDPDIRISSSLSDQWTQARYIDIARLIGRFRQMHADREHAFANPTTFSTSRMGAKRKALVEHVGFDAKQAAHLIRALRMSEELLTTGDLRVYRTDDADELRAIKRGEWSLDEVRAERERLVPRIEAALKSSNLPEEPDHRRISETIQSLHFEACRSAFELQQPRERDTRAGSSAPGHRRPARVGVPH